MKHKYNKNYDIFCKNSGHQSWVWLWNRTKSFLKRGLIRTPQPKIPRTTNTYVHLKDLQINDHDPKSELPVYVILGISDYTKTKTQERPRVGLP